MLFIYSILNKDGIKEEGEVSAGSFDDALVLLQNRGVTVVNLKEKVRKGILEESGIKYSFFKKHIKDKDIVIFSRQVATLFEAGVPALKGFRMLALESTNTLLRECLTQVSDDIESGVSLSKALSKQSEVFSAFYISMVRSGEESGRLSETFLFLADHLDREYELHQKTTKALTYPAFVVGTFIIVMVVMFVFIIPRMTALFTEQGTELPLITRFIIGISDFFVSYSLIIFPLVGVGVWMGLNYIKTEEGGYAFDELKTRIPALGKLFQMIFLARLSENMNTLLSSGVPIVKSIEITADVADNKYYKEVLLRIAERVRSGRAFSSALYDEKSVPNLLVQMTKIGEETGRLSYILKNLSNFYKREVDTTIDTVVGLIEPIMIVGLGLGVGVLVASVLLPMYTLSGSITFASVLLFV